MDIRVADDAHGAAALAADWIARRARAAVRRRGAFSLAVSGGAGPGAMFDELARLDVPWERATILQVDERVAPDGSPDRNATMLGEHLGAAARRAKVRLMPVTASDVRRAAGRYTAHVTAAAPIDVVHLGMGDDGHTASWPPGDPVADLRGPDAPAVVVVGPFNGLRRMTLTPPVVNAARARLMFVTGAAKAEMLERWIVGGDVLPVQRLRRTATVVVLDRAAAARLPTG